MIKILIVDDSETEIAILKQIFSMAKDLEVVGCAKNGKDAIELVEILNPDLITMDIQMPVMNGFEATRQIMQKNPKPIVVISSRLNDITLNASFRALEAGALTVLAKPENIGSKNFNKDCKYMIDIIRGMAEIKSIKRRFFLKKPLENTIDYPDSIENVKTKYKLIAMGASVGGPQALKFILDKLPPNFPIPIVIVQHITPGFLGGFVQWLNDEIALHVKIAESDEVVVSGNVYLAPDLFHLKIDANLVVRLIKSPLVSGFCPSITELFSSVAQACGKYGIGILLTGMGHDGAQGLLAMKNAKARTIIQDRASSVVFGMAAVAQSLHAADKVMSLESIANYLISVGVANTPNL